VPGPPPKDPAIRQRRNVKAEQAELSVPPAGTIKIPKLPTRHGLKWHPLAMKWWKDLWESPMAPRFLNTDANELVRAAVLIDDFWRATSPDDRAKLDAAIIRQTSRFGLSNWDRNRMNWTITAAAEEKPRPQSQPQSPTLDPRKVLRAV
jgi:hypothetical protein